MRRVPNRQPAQYHKRKSAQVFGWFTPTPKALSVSFEGGRLPTALPPQSPSSVCVDSVDRMAKRLDCFSGLGCFDLGAGAEGWCSDLNS